MTSSSPQSHAPPAWLLNMLKSWPSWLPAWKQSAHNDIQGEIPQSLHRYATKFLFHTRPQIVGESNDLKTFLNSSGGVPLAISHKHQSWLSASNECCRLRMSSKNPRISLRPFSVWQRALKFAAFLCFSLTEKPCLSAILHILIVSLVFCHCCLVLTAHAWLSWTSRVREETETSNYTHGQIIPCFSNMATSAVSTTDRFYFTKEQLENTPSRKNGVDPEKEQSYRQQAATLIQDMGQRLSVYLFEKERSYLPSVIIR